MAGPSQRGIARSTFSIDCPRLSSLRAMTPLGKGGAIRRVTSALDARCYDNVPVAAPTEEERAQPYLWRFWRHLPRRGSFVFFDRSWYGRVLVERVEGFCTEADWMRAYTEINDFEQALGAPRNRDRQVLACNHQGQSSCGASRSARKSRSSDSRSPKKTGATARSGTPTSPPSATWWTAPRLRTAPWTLVEANNKYHARIRVLKVLCEAVEDALGRISKKGVKKKKKM